MYDDDDDDDDDDDVQHNHILKVIWQTAGWNFTIFSTPVELSTKINWLDFEIKRSKVSNIDHSNRSQGHKVERSQWDHTYGQISTFGGIFLPIFRMHGHILMRLTTITHHQVHTTLMTCSRSWFKGHGLKVMV